MIMDVGLTTTTIVEVKDIPNTGEEWKYLKKKFMKSSGTNKMLRSMMIKNGKLSKSSILIYTEESFNTGLNSLGLMKTKHGILPQTLWDHLTDYVSSIWIILNALDH